MKRILSVLLLSCSISVFSQTGQWTWLQGDTAATPYHVYGTKGVPAESNYPGSRSSPSHWSDSSGNLWLFGGSNSAFSPEGGNLNDLWKYESSSGKWTWVGGDTLVNQTGVYGTKGTASPGNKPGTRSGTVSWSDAAGNLWMFGGSFYTANSSGLLNELWKYNISTGQWTWVSGDKTLNSHGVYETRGVPSATAHPGARANAVTWKDPAGNFWMYGGFGYATVISTGYLNDLWMFDPVLEQWTWVNGENSIERKGIYGVQGVADSANKPSARVGAVGWTDTSGNFWLFGGLGNSATAQFGSGYFNDLWKYNPSKGQWTWINGDSAVEQPGNYGIKGKAASTNKPQSRQYAISWSDNKGTLWMLGGNGYSRFKRGTLNDLWKYVPSTNEWTWMSGDSTTYAGGRYGTQGIADAANTPRATSSAIPWTDSSDNLWLFGSNSTGYDQGGIVNDIWKFSMPAGQWIWISGDTLGKRSGIYGKKGIADPGNRPGTRSNSVSWTDTAGNLWLFGGVGYAPGGEGNLNDLWKYTPSSGQWTWISGDNTILQTGVYGIRGMPSVSNKPGARHSSVCWTDAAGNIWLFGGRGYDELTGYEGAFNDLWKFDILTGQWTWMNGGKVIDAKAVFGIKRMSAGTNIPGSRQAAVGWKDSTGNLWLFGGIGYASDYNDGFLSDIWKYAPSTGEWTWMSGDNTVDQYANFGTKGKAAATNTPGGRQRPVGWTDLSGNFWLFGGDGRVQGGLGRLNDLWKFAPSTGLWTWMTGDSQSSAYGFYGTKGVPAPFNTPGGRSNAVNMTDAAGNFWLFGGQGNAARDGGILNDLWKYTPATGLWTWVSGDNTPNQFSVYGMKGVASPQNKPGARYAGTGWADPSGKIWLFSGSIGYIRNSRFGLLNDFWQYSFNQALPVKPGSFTARKQQQTVLLNWTGFQDQNSSIYIVQRSSDGTLYDSIGVREAVRTTSVAASYLFTDQAPLTGTNFYRLKQPEPDGNFLYSGVQKVVMDKELSYFYIIGNPVQTSLQVKIQLPKTQKLAIQVRDMKGHLLVNQEHIAREGSSLYTIPVDFLATGAYLLSVKANDLSSTKTFLKQ